MHAMEKERYIEKAADVFKKVIVFHRRDLPSVADAAKEATKRLTLSSEELHAIHKDFELKRCALLERLRQRRRG